MGFLGFSFNQTEAAEQSAKTALFITDSITKGCEVSFKLADFCLNKANEALGNVKQNYDKSKAAYDNQKAYVDIAKLLMQSGLDPEQLKETLKNQGVKV
jgi:intergrase/recombinase